MALEVAARLATLDREGFPVCEALPMTSSSAQVSWVYLNRYAYLGVQDRSVVAVAYWTPETLGEEFSDDDPGGLSEPVIVEAGYFPGESRRWPGDGFRNRSRAERRVARRVARGSGAHAA